MAVTETTPMRRPGAPVDRLLATYAIAGGVALLFAHRREGWWLLAIAHLAAIAIGFGTRPALRIWDYLVRRLPRAVPIFGDVYAVLLVPLLYAELPALNLAVWNGRYFDDLIIGIEQAVFGGQPSLEWWSAMPWLPLSEVLHSAYLSYYLVIFLPPMLIWWKAGREAMRQAVFALMLVFVVHYLFFIWFPVQGPRYLFPPPGGVIAEGKVYALAHRLLEAGSSRGAAFPSSHVGVAVGQTVICLRYYRPLGYVLAFVAVGLACGAVYGGFHYATDAITGAVVGGFLASVAPSAYRWIQARS